MQNVRARSAASLVAGGALAACVLASCVSEPSLEELAAQTVIITQVAPGTDFATFRTFAIGDVIPLVEQTESDGGVAITRPVDPAIATPTIEAIAAELSSRGYRRIDRTEQPDLGVAVVALVRLSAVVPYGAWWGYGAATGGYWGYAGSSFSSGISSSGIALWRSGALVIEIYDLRAARDAAPLLQSPAPTAVAPDGGAAPPIPAVWAAFIYGVIGGVDATLEAPPIDGVRQAFAQSPYLKTP